MTLSDLCLVLVPSGVSGIVSVGLPGLEDREVPILLLDELELNTVTLDFGTFFLGFSAAFAA